MRAYADDVGCFDNSVTVDHVFKDVRLRWTFVGRRRARMNELRTAKLII